MTRRKPVGYDSKAHLAIVDLRAVVQNRIGQNCLCKFEVKFLHVTLFREPIKRPGYDQVAPELSSGI